MFDNFNLMTKDGDKCNRIATRMQSNSGKVLDGFQHCIPVSIKLKKPIKRWAFSRLKTTTPEIYSFKS